MTTKKLLLLFLAGIAVLRVDAADPLRTALTFHASFDGGVDADFGPGDRKLYNAPSMNKRDGAVQGLPTNSFVALARGEGRFGDALRFKDKSETTVFFRAASNIAWRDKDWSGTVSLWLNTDPPGELKPGFCDPIQITPRAWNDAAFFVEFEKRPTGIPFRLGTYADLKVWNPGNRKWEDIPMADKPLLTVEKPPFSKGKWTHVVFTFEHFNTGQPDGVARLYLDGKLQGALPARTQTFTWDLEKTAIMLGLSYVGLYDELSLFNRALTPDEVSKLHTLEGGVKSLMK